MKREFLQGFKLEKEEIDQIMTEYGKGIERFKQQVTDITGERDGLKTQLADVAKKLGAFEGVDLEALKKEITTLKGDIATKEADFTAQLADRDFQSALSTEIMAAKGKSAKAVMALLNLDTLKASKNQKEDIAAALKALQTSDAYLFDDGKSASTVAATPSRVSTGGAHDENGGAAPSSTSQTMNALFRGDESKGA
jgi:predicted  nucleic acid-binding Zn-ribbon protein